MAPKTSDPKDLVLGGVLQCVEAATLGLPFEVWKTHMGTYRNETTMQAFKNIYSKGALKFWAGLQPKMVESFLKGGILLFSKEAIIRQLSRMGMGDVSAGLIGGFGGGVSQVVVMGPCTFLVTAAVANNAPVLTQIRSTLATKGVRGFYSGGTALTLRQGSNWASRQGLTDLMRSLLRTYKYGDPKAKLSTGEEAVCGVIGGSLSTWNQPFEVLRIQAQGAAARNEASVSMLSSARSIVKESGVAGLFKGIVPRLGICVW